MAEFDRIKAFIITVIFLGLVMFVFSSFAPTLTNAAGILSNQSGLPLVSLFSPTGIIITIIVALFAVGMCIVAWKNLK